MESQIPLEFTNCTNENIQVNWDAYKFSVDTHWVPPHMNGQFVIPPNRTIKNVTLFQQLDTVGIYTYADAQINFNFTTPSGPALMHIDNHSRCWWAPLSCSTNQVSVTGNVVSKNDDYLSPIGPNQYFIACQ